MVTLYDDSWPLQPPIDTPRPSVSADPPAYDWPEDPPRRDVGPTQRLVASAGEEIARLAQLLRELRCTAVMHGVDGSVVPLRKPGSPTSTLILPETGTISAPIYDAQGAPLAFLKLAGGDINSSDSAQALLRTLIQSAARDLTERWFRICYRRCWIVAAVHERAETFIILATDREQRLVGADRQARRLLEARGDAFGNQLTLAAFFRVDAAVLWGRRYRDHALRLRGSHDGAPWSVLITPPDSSSAQQRHADRMLLHARPRFDTLVCIEPAGKERRPPCGLPPQALRRLEQYIEAHLDDVLNVEELAGGLGMSTSHFSRSFRNSVGLPPHGYVMQRRLLRAQELLVQTDLAMAQIALTTGFSDQSHFCRRFHEFSGLSPRAFRAQHR